jgi:hypothetical protein
MAWPAITAPLKKWYYLSNTGTVLYSQAEITRVICVAKAGGYTGFFLYEMNVAPWRSSGDTTFGTTAKTKLRSFTSQCRAVGLDVAGVTDSNPDHIDCYIDYQNIASVSEKLVGITIENEWWWYSYNNPATKANALGPGKIGTYSFLSMKNNLLSRRTALLARGLLTYGYVGWLKRNLEFYTDQPGMDGSQVTGGHEANQLQGVFDVMMWHSYYKSDPKNGPNFGYAAGRMEDVTWNAESYIILSVESAFSKNFFEGKNELGAVVYPKKTIQDAWDYLTLSMASGTPQGNSEYFNNPSTHANIKNFINLTGIVIFTYGRMKALSAGNGPFILVNAGNDIVNNSPSFPNQTANPVGTACDDELPVGRTLTYLWSIVSQPGGGLGNFNGTETSLIPTFTFEVAGTYVLRLTASDGTVSSYDDMQILVSSPPAQKHLRFNSSPGNGVVINLSPADINAISSAPTPFIAEYDATTAVTATAPATFGGNVFQKWTRGGFDFSFSPTILLDDLSSHVLYAVYVPTPPARQRVQIVSNYANIDYDISVTDANGNPVGLTGTCQDILHYYVGQIITITAKPGSTFGIPSFQGFYANHVFVPSSGPTILTHVVTSNYGGDTIAIMYGTGDRITAYGGTADWQCFALEGTNYISPIILVPNNAPAYSNTFTVELYSGGTISEPYGINATCSGTLLATSVYTSQQAASGFFQYFANPPFGVDLWMRIIDDGGLYTTMVLGPFRTEKPPALSVSVVGINADCTNPSPSARANVDITGGIAPYTYQWWDYPGESINWGTDDYIEAPAGTYIVYVTDANGCTAFNTITLEDTVGIRLVESIITHPNCLLPTGAIQVEVTGGVEPYEYTWTPSAPDSNYISGLSPGSSYMLHVEDSLGCQTSPDLGPFVIGPAPELIISISGNFGSVVCEGQAVVLTIDSISVNGAETPVDSILWSNGATGLVNNIGLLAPGSYSYWAYVVKDGCAKVQTFEFDVIAASTDPLVVTLDVAPDGCGINDYELSVAGTGAFTGFYWEPTLETTTGIAYPSSGLTAPIEYWVVGINAYGCRTESNHIIVSPAPPPTISAVSVTNVACNAAANTGAINVDVTGGCEPYAYAWTGPTGFTATTKDISGLYLGTYNLLVTDNLGQTVALTETIIISSPRISNIAIVDESCAGANTGSINYDVTGGTFPYSFLWNDGATTQNRANIPGGSYSVLVTDANGCTIEGFFDVSSIPPARLGINALCPEAGTRVRGWAQALVTGGSGIFTYQWSKDGVVLTGETTDVVRFSSSGLYSVEVTDIAGCTYTAQFICEDVPEIIDEVDEDCAKKHNLMCCVGDYAYKAIMAEKTGAFNATCLKTKSKTLMALSRVLLNNPEYCLTETEIEALWATVQQFCGCKNC